MLSMLAVVATVGSLVLLGCPGDSDLHNPATPSDLNNKSFTFASGSAFNSALTNVSTVVSFSNNATNFALQATVQNVMRTATGTYDFDSCILTVGHTSGLKQQRVAHYCL
jgi:hypothetical protein